MKYLKLVLPMLLVLSISCTHQPAIESLSNCDWSQALQNKEPKEIPYQFSIQQSKGQVIFIAADHGDEKTNKKTFDLIRNQLANFKPAIVIVESLETVEGTSSAKYLNEIELGQRQMGEPAFLATEAHKLKIDFLGGEISDKELLEYLVTKGYSQKDMAGFYILRSWSRNERTLDREIKSKRWPVIGQFKDDIEFKKWFLKMTNKELASERDAKWTLPFQGRSDGLQDLANQLTWARDRHLAKVIKQSLKEKGETLVVYGAGHAAPQRCFLNQEMQSL